MVDDLIAYLHADDHVFLIPNAANTAEVVAPAAARPRRPGSRSPTSTRRTRCSPCRVRARPRCWPTLGLPTEHDVHELRRRQPSTACALTVCRTGYTGEHGYELVVPSGPAGAVWDALMKAGGAVRAARRPVSAARDTLRTEMGYPLHGQDLSLDISPVQARLGLGGGLVASRSSGAATALIAEKEAGPRRLLWGLEALDRGIPAAAHGGAARDDADVGEVTSGTFSPTKRVGIALALLDTAAGLGPGDEVEVDVRGRPARMRVVKPPFVTPSVPLEAPCSRFSPVEGGLGPGALDDAPLVVLDRPVDDRRGVHHDRTSGPHLRLVHGVGRAGGRGSGTGRARTSRTPTGTPCPRSAGQGVLDQQLLAQVERRPTRTGPGCRSGRPGPWRSPGPWRRSARRDGSAPSAMPKRTPADVR